MKITSYNTLSFASNEKKRNYNVFIYPSIQGLGAYIGYSIPLKEIDGPDMINDMGRTLNLRKTKVPNIVGKWKNAMTGAFIGTGIAIIADIIITKICNNKTKAQNQASEK